MKNTNYELCNACGVCNLSCPLWRHARDITITAGGRAMAIKGGAQGDELLPLTRKCVLCGACAAVCPMGVDTVGITIGIRSGLDMNALGKSMPRSSAAKKAFFMPGAALRSDSRLLDKTLSLLRGYALADDDAEPLVAAIEGRAEISQSEAVEHMRRLGERADRLIASEGLLHRIFRNVLGHGNVIGLGEALLSIESVRKGLRPDDLYIIDSRAYHSDFRRLCGFYDRLRRAIGLTMNLDLQRSASASGAASGVRGIDPEAQARWIIQGRNFRRIVVERVEDMAVFRAVSDAPVAHLSEAGDR